MPDKPEPQAPPGLQNPLQEEVLLTGPWSPIAQVADACDLPRDEIIDAAEKGAVWWQKATGASRHRKPVRLRALDHRVSEGDLILVNYNRQVLQEIPAVPELVSDQGNYSVWNKPAGMLSQGTRWSDHCSITYTVEKTHGKKASLVHRLDRAASGLIMIAHTRNALVALTGMFATRRIKKTYHAVVRGTFKEELPCVIDDPIDGKEAHTEVISATKMQSSECSQTPCDETSLTVTIKTGRKHQIRSHLASRGHPVVGDRLFDKNREHHCDLKLTSTALQFICPFSAVELDIRLPARKSN